MIHGDLKGVCECPKHPPNLLIHVSQPSVLVDDTGRARLTDFGLAAVVLDFGSVGSIKDGHAVRWAAPEILDKEQPVSKKSDVYSFAMVTIEVCLKIRQMNKVSHKVLGSYWTSTVLWDCAYHGGGRHFSGKTASTTDVPAPNKRALGND